MVWPWLVVLWVRSAQAVGGTGYSTGLEEVMGKPLPPGPQSQTDGADASPSIVLWSRPIFTEEGRHPADRRAPMACTGLLIDKVNQTICYPLVLASLGPMAFEFSDNMDNRRPGQLKVAWGADLAGAGAALQVARHILPQAAAG